MTKPPSTEGCLLVTLERPVSRDTRGHDDRVGLRTGTFLPRDTEDSPLPSETGTGLRGTPTSGCFEFTGNINEGEEDKNESPKINQGKLKGRG